jgi:type IV pilus assembly protein PilA
MKMFRKDEGFTLVELMVVVLIIGILVAIAVPVFNSAKASAQKKSCYANERTVEGAFQTYRADGDETGTTIASFADYATLIGTLSPKYVKTAPVCNAGANSYSLAAAPATSTATISCSNTGHGVHP